MLYVSYGTVKILKVNQVYFKGIRLYIYHMCDTDIAMKYHFLPNVRIDLEQFDKNESENKYEFFHEV